MISEVEWIKYFAEEVKYHMKQKRMSQREFADRSRLAESTICDVIYGRRIPSFRTVYNIAYGLGVGIEELTDFGSIMKWLIFERSLDGKEKD